MVFDRIAAKAIDEILIICMGLALFSVFSNILAAIALLLKLTLIKYLDVYIYFDVYHVVIAYLLVAFVYYVSFWLRGHTIGMSMMGLVITNSSTERITAKQAVVRYFLDCLAKLSLGILYLPALLDPKHLTVPDRASKTYVYKNSKVSVGQNTMI